MIIGISGYSGSGKDTVGMIIQYLSIEDKENVSIHDVIDNKEDYQKWLNEKSKWEIKKFAGKLKDIATILTGISQEKFEDQQFKKTNLSYKWGTVKEDGYQPMTVRDLLQKLGTDALRKGLHENVWVNALMADYKRKTSLSKFRYIKGYIQDRKAKGLEKRITGQELYEYCSEVNRPDWIITDTRFPNEANAIRDKGGIVIRINKPGITPINAHPSETGLDGWDFDYQIDNSSDITALTEEVKRVLKKSKLYE